MMTETASFKQCGIFGQDLTTEFTVKNIDPLELCSGVKMQVEIVD